MKKIVILGPESTGKSTLCEELATHYNTTWVREYAREYLLKNGTNYSFEDIWKIAEGQMASEELVSNGLRVAGSVSHVHQTSASNSSLSTPNPQPATGNPQLPLFIDTDLYVMKIWSEIVFNKCDNRILNKIVNRQYDLYLLCDTDLPWVEDELREYPDLKQRQKIYQFYLDAMINQNVPWVNISGNYEERLKKAIAAVDSML